MYPQISSQVLIDNHSLAPIIHDVETGVRSGYLQIWLFGYLVITGHLVCHVTAFEATTKKRKENLLALARNTPSLQHKPSRPHSHPAGIPIENYLIYIFIECVYSILRI